MVIDGRQRERRETEVVKNTWNSGFKTTGFTPNACWTTSANSPAGPSGLRPCRLIDRRSEGAQVRFKLQPRSPDGRADPCAEIACFTTRIDTIYGCTYMVLAPRIRAPAATGQGAAAGIRRSGICPAVTASPPRNARTPRKKRCFYSSACGQPFQRRNYPIRWAIT